MPTIFLSPSTQEWNPYYSGGSEEQFMNEIADRMEPYLRSSGIDFTRNDPARNVGGAISDSNLGNYDAHIALHSNAAGGEYAGKLRGIDIYYAPGSAEGEALATIIANNFKSIYPLPDQVRAISTTTLGELTQTRAVAILAEIGYHDNPEDEAWIRANIAPIARNLVESLTEYFGIPFIPAGPVRRGTAATDGTGVNIRSLPSTKGAVLGSIPNRTTVNVYGETGDWYVVRYNGVPGYANRNFIRLGSKTLNGPYSIKKVSK